MSPIDYSLNAFTILKNRTCAEILVEYLAVEGVEYVFGVTGGTIVPLIEALDRSKKIRFIMAKHETGAAFMADFYSRLSGKLGVCLSTAGPGATNMLTGIACAHQDNVPLLAVTGQPATHTMGKGAVQESSEFGIDTTALYGEVCGVSATIIDPSVFGQMVTLGIRTCLGEHKQTAHLSIPANVSSARIPEYAMPVEPRTYRVSHSSIDRELVKKAVNALVEAKKPVIMLGSGVKSISAKEDLIELAHILGSPVVTTPRGKGCFPEAHPLSLRVFGFAGSPAAKKLVFESGNDLLLVIGSSLCEWTTESWDPRMHPSKYLIQIDSDPQRIGRNYPVSQGIVGDLEVCVKVLVNRLKEVGFACSDTPERRERVYKMAAGIRAAAGVYENPESMTDDSEPIRPPRLMHELNKCLDRDAVVIADAGNSYAWTLHYLDINPPQEFFIPLGFASMGHGTAGVVGAKIAAGKRQVVAVVGDGSMLMYGNEIHTAAEYGVPAIWIVLNDSGWGMVDHGIRLLSGRSIGAKFHHVNFAEFAGTLGAEGFRVTSPGLFAETFRRAVASERPAVIDVCINADEQPPFLERIRGIQRYQEQSHEGE